MGSYGGENFRGPPSLGGSGGYNRGMEKREQRLTVAQRPTYTDPLPRRASDLDDGPWRAAGTVGGVPFAMTFGRDLEWSATPYRYSLTIDGRPTLLRTPSFGWIKSFRRMLEDAQDALGVLIRNRTAS